MNQPELGKLILELRQKKGMTQTELANECNLSLRTIQRIEYAEVTPRNYTVKVILTALHYDGNIDSNFIQSKPKSSERRWFGQLKELFNLKKDTMKKISVLSLILISIISSFIFLSSNANGQVIDNWFLTGSKKESYTIGLDKSVYKTGNSSAYIESKDEKIKGFGTLMQSCSAENYLGKRVKMTAYIKSKDIKNRAGMWMRVDSRQPKKTLSFDNMKERPIKGTTNWTKYEIILDVPEESGMLNYGVLINGTGKVWFDNVRFEIVDKASVKSTSKPVKLKKPTNLDFGD
ncbi:MAG: multiprotein-bridging factor 1 family protein [Moheibacter sp.]